MIKGLEISYWTWCVSLVAGVLGLSILTSAYAQTNHVEIVVENGYRYIRSNGIPNHAPGAFPNAHNPNIIAPQNYAFRVPAEPKAGATVTRFNLTPFGIALNGIPFDPAAAEFWNRDRRSGWQYEATGGVIDLGLDQNNAHVQPGGDYHYHGVPWGLIETLGSAKGMVLVGYAADGFPIYAVYGYADPKDPKSRLVKVRSSYRLKQGTRPSGPGGNYDGSFTQDYEWVKGAGDLDECNGRFGVTPEYPAGIYHYYIVEEFPYIPRAFHGAPDISFERRGPPPGGRGGPGGPRGPGGPGGFGPPPGGPR